MPLIGEIITTSNQASRDGTPVTLRVIRLAPVYSNQEALARVSTEWGQTVDTWGSSVGKDVRDRGRFVSGVAFDAAKELYYRQGVEPIILVAVTPGDKIVGVQMSFLHDSVLDLHVQGTEPQSLAGAPGQEHLRGVGTALTKALGIIAERQGIREAQLVPLDDAARAFWTNRGFRAVDGYMALQAPSCLQTHCSDDRPDIPWQGDEPLAGSYAEVGKYNFPWWQ